ncbi:MAG: hypothetical protein LRY55_13855, partial [Leadbetterella sp.]|nr:hypothetical protein [Leadbetterella sp.]
VENAGQIHGFAGRTGRPDQLSPVIRTPEAGTSPPGVVLSLCFVIHFKNLPESFFVKIKGYF